MTEKPSIKKNIFSMFLLQGAGYIIPLITVPFLVRVLGPSHFGLVQFALGFAQIFVFIVDGFNLSAAALVAKNRTDHQKVSQVFSATMTVKVVIMLLCFCIMGAIVVLTPSLRSDWLVYLFAFATVPGTVLFPFWFFHGMEQMKYISGVTITARVLSAIALFAFVREGDYVLATAIQSTSVLIIGGIGFRYVWKVVPLKLSLPSKEHIIETIHEGKHLFYSTVASSLCTSSNIFILGIFTDHTIVGYYSAADKILTAVRGLIYPISQSVYPRINALINESIDKAVALIRKSLIYTGVLSFMTSCALFVLASPVVHIALGEGFESSVTLVRIMSFTPFITALSNVFGLQTMLPFGMKSEFSVILAGSGVINILIMAILVTQFGGPGAAVATTLTQILITVAMAAIIYIKKESIMHTGEAVIPIKRVNLLRGEANQP